MEIRDGKNSDPGQKKFGSATLDFITQRNITLNEAKRRNMKI
jgi:hypothetical protein